MINFDNLKCVFIKTLERRRKNGQAKPMIEVIYELEHVLPFVEYMHNLHLYSYQYSLCNFEVHLALSDEDMLAVFEYPFVAPRARQQWCDIMSQFEEYAKRHYTCSSYVPVIDGELIQEGVVYSLTRREVIGGIK